jgi:hypothetical protein
VPAGDPKGGQWTDKGGGARSPEEIDKEIAHLMRDPDALRHADPSIVQPARFQLFRRPIQRPPSHPVIQRGTEAALALFTALSARNTPGQRAVFDFNAREFLRDPQGTLDPKRNVKLLNQQEVENVCRKLDDVQRRTDRVASAVRADRPYLNPQQFGTAVHTDVAHEINDPRKPDGSPKDSNYRAEVSYWKMAEDGVYGKKDSIRIDVLEDAGRGLVCVYDIKTGQSRRSGLDLGRMREIAENVLGAYPHVKRVIITEVRPRR